MARGFVKGDAEAHQFFDSQRGQATKMAEAYMGILKEVQAHG
jgi:hypothetical protein